MLNRKIIKRVLARKYIYFTLIFSGLLYCNQFFMPSLALESILPNAKKMQRKQKFWRVMGSPPHTHKTLRQSSVFRLVTLFC